MLQFEREQAESVGIVPLHSPDPQNDISQVKSNQKLQEILNLPPLQIQEDSSLCKDENCSSQKEDPGHTSEEGNDPGRFHGEKPKTANKAFGRISDFLSFFKNRNSQINKFDKQFEKMQKVEKEDPHLATEILNREIRPLLYDSFAKMTFKYKALYYQETAPDTLTQENTEMEDQAKQKEIEKFEIKLKQYAKMFKDDFSSLQGFYEKLLYAYTFSSFLYKRVNKFLRNEDWMSLDGLLLYTYCLFKAFLGFEATESFEFLQSVPKLNDKLLLFRGSAFDQESLDFYKPGKIKHFSWNSVISTSLEISQTKKFMKRAKKKPILIVIEVDFKELKSKDLNALYLARLSKCPDEKEVALAPGSIFEFVYIQEVQGKDHEVEMRLRLVTNAKTLAHRGLFLHGMLQAVMRNAHDFKIVFLKGKELSRAIKHCKGNELIKDLEFCLCNFNEKTIETLLEILPTMKNLESFRINAVTLEKDCDLDRLVECLKEIKIVNLDILNSFSQDHQIKSVLESTCSWDCLRKLRISFDDDALVHKQTIKDACNLSVNHLNAGCVFELNISNGWSIFIKGLQKNDFEKELENILGQKFSLTRSKGQEESKYWEVQDEKNFERFIRKTERASVTGRLNTQFFFMERDFQAGERSLWEILETKFSSRSEDSPLWNLVYLSMKFASPSSLKDFESQKKFCEALQHLKSLEDLQMSFDGYEDMTDEVLINISLNGINHLQSLTHLYLSFDLCNKITDEGLKNLSIEAIGHLKLLSILDLSFDRCGDITDEGMRNLSIEAIQHLKLLTTLRLRFNGYQNITDVGLKSLTCEGIKHLESLTTLHLSFDRCHNITDEGLASLGESLEHVKKLLKVLYLSFDVCGKITDQGLKTLSDGGIKHLELLKALYLSFNVCSGLTDRGLKGLVLKGIQHLKQLSTLYLSFDWCPKMTDVGLRSLSSGGIQCLTSLKKLCLSFKGCHEMTDIGLRILSRQGIKYLKSLTVLHLNFNVCNKMTDQEFRTLCREGIKNLKLLTDLQLSFDGCFQITGQGLAILGYDGINYLCSLTRLSLSFNKCKWIQEEDVICLSRKGMQHLKLLKAFYLSFDRSENITDKLGWGDAFIEKLDRDPCFDFFFFSDLAIEKTGIEIINNLKFHDLGGALVLCQGQFGLRVEDISSEKDERSPSSELSKYVYHLKEALCLENLRQLHLRFPPREAITDLHLSERTIPMIARLKSLNKLDITLEECSQITDVGLGNLFSEGIQHLHLLTALSLNFSKCGRITNKGLESLCLDGFRNLRLITALKLSFNECSQITDEGLKFLPRDGVQYLKSLNSLFISALNTGVTEEIEKIFEISSLKSVVLLINKRTEEGKLGNCNLKRLNANLPDRETSDQVNKIIDKKVPLDVVLCKRPTFNYKNKLHILNEDTFKLMLIAEEDKKLESLELVFDSCEGILDRLINTLLDDRTNLNESVLTLNLKFKKCSEITSKWIGRLFSEGIQHLKSLTTLNLSFDECENLIDEEFKTLNCERIEQLTALHLSFNKCYNVADAGLEFAISFGIQHCQLLTTFDLCFDECQGITNEGLKTLSSKGIQHLKSLTNLHLSFVACKNIKDEGLKSLGLDGLQHLKSLEVLYLRFDQCENITSDGLKSLGFEGIQHLNILKVLNLRFDRCENISGEGVQGLTYEGIEHLKSLTTLHLSFGCCYEFTNKVLRTISENGMQYKSLKTLYLRFNAYQSITDEGLKSLSFDGIQHLEKLTTLQLNFNNCEKITGIGLESLSCQGIRNLKLLTTLHLSFDGCKSIQEWGLKSLFREGIQHLPELTALYLSFNAILSFTDYGMKSLAYSLQNLKLLEIFELRASWCRNISDEGLECLSSKGIKRLTSLTSLYLGFNDCDKITDSGLESLSWGLEPLTSLTFLHLTFNKCFYITNKGLEDLSYGIQNLKALITLNLNFNNCKEITNTGAANFSQIGLENLKSVDISFGRCERITSKALDTFLLNGFYQLCGPSPPLISARRISLSLSQRSNTNAANIICENQIGFSLANTTSEEVLLSSLLDKHFTEKNKAINRLTFKFEDASQITDDDFYNVYFQPNEFSVFEELETLHFNFENCNQMTNEGMKLLCRGGMLSFKSLKVLHLSFAHCNKITDRALKSLCGQIVEFLKELHELQLNFSECTEITDKGLEILCYDGIQHLNGLTTLGLKFDGCSQLTSEGLKTLVSQGISKLRYLVDLHLSFSRCSKIPDLILQSFLKILSYFDFKKYQTRFKSISI